MRAELSENSSEERNEYLIGNIMSSAFLHPGKLSKNFIK